MNRPQPDLVPQRARQSGGQVRVWMRLLAVLVSVGLGSLVAADDDETEAPEWELDTPTEVTGRAQLIPVDPAETETEDDSEESLLWPESGLLRMSASQDPPFLVPLPEPQRIPPLPPVPLPPAVEPVPENGAEALPIPVLDPFCPDCQRQGGANGGLEESLPPGSMLINPVDDHFGIGSRQVPFALFHIDSVEPLPQMRLRADFLQGLKTPDRAERYWAAPPRGPSQPESKVNSQIFSVYNETGGDHFAAFTEVPLIFLNPEVNGNTSGLGNITIGQKFLLTNPNNRRWQIAQILRTYLPTGSASRGLGNGLVALEPGLLFRYRANELTYFHGELKYWIPTNGDPAHAGQIVQYGTGVSRVLWQTDERAVLSTLELIGSTIGDGQATLPDGTLKRVNGETFFSILPGIRTTLGPSGDLGLLEVGVSSGLTFAGAGWYDSRVLFDLRWSY